MLIFSRLALVYLLVLCGPVGAQGLDLGSVNYGTPAQGGTLVGGSITLANPPGFTRVIPVAASSGDVVVRDGIKVRVGSADVAMVLERKMPWQQVARAAASIGRTLPYVATAVAFIDLMDSLRLRSDGSGWKQDPGRAEETQIVWEICPENGTCNASTVLRAGSPVAAMSAWAANFNATTRPRCNGSAVVGGSGPFSTYSANGVFQMLSPTWAFVEAVESCSGSVISRQSFRQTAVMCPATIDALNPALSIPAGLPVGYDGKCRTGRYTDPKTETQAGDIANANGAKAGAAGVVGSMLGRGVDLAPYTDTPTASGPSSVPQPGSTTTTTGPNGTTTGTSSPTTVITYNGPSYTWNDSTVITTTNGGVTTTTTTVAPPVPEIQTCGLPGKPPCKIDETGTPAVIPPFSTTPIDATKTTDAAKQDTEIGRVVNPGFGWFTVPPMATCAPIAWPGGVQINPCNGIEVVRSIMAYLWALYGAVWSFGVFRRSLPGAA